MTEADTIKMAQATEGDWGGFHSGEQGAKQRVPTTEAALESALAARLGPFHPVISL